MARPVQIDFSFTDQIDIVPQVEVIKPKRKFKLIHSESDVDLSGDAVFAFGKLDGIIQHGLSQVVKAEDCNVPLAKDYIAAYESLIQRIQAQVYYIENKLME